jgi:hypothetical protein
VSVSGGDLILSLASASSGAMVQTPNNGFSVPVGSYVEARVYFSGNGSELYNWPAFWLSGPNWPNAGEHDIGEVWDGKLTMAYHSPSGAHSEGAPSGYWGDGFHEFGIMRNASSASIYWDGNLVASYATDDNGAGEQIIFNTGAGTGSPAAYGAASQLKVDYVHVYENNPNAVAVTPQAGYGGPGDTGGGGTVTPPPPPPPSTTTSPDGTKITSASDAPIVDATGNSWSLVQSSASTKGLQIAVNGTVDAVTHNVTLLEYSGGKIYQENAAGQWYSESQPNDSWVQTTDPSGGTVPTDKLVLSLSEDAYNGNAQFIAKVDGQQIGGPTAVTALHSQGQSQDFTFQQAWGAGTHNVEIDFINDAYGGSPHKDRNLYINKVTYDGASYGATPKELLWNSSFNVTVGHS